MSDKRHIDQMRELLEDVGMSDEQISDLIARFLKSESIPFVRTLSFMSEEWGDRILDLAERIRVARAAREA